MLELKKTTKRELEKVMDDLAFQRGLRGKTTELSMDEVIMELINAYWDLQSLKAQLRFWDGLEAGYLKVVASTLSEEEEACHNKRPNFYELWCKGEWPYNL